MKTFTLELLSPTSAELLNNVVSFVARDSSGSFGILPDARRRIAALSYGLAVARFADGRVEYLGLPGGLLYFLNNRLQITCESFVRDSNSEKITEVLQQKRKKDENAVSEIKRSLHRLDEEILRRLSQVKWGSSP